MIHLLLFLCMNIQHFTCSQQCLQCDLIHFSLALCVNVQYFTCSQHCLEYSVLTVCKWCLCTFAYFTPHVSRGTMWWAFTDRLVGGKLLLLLEMIFFFSVDFFLMCSKIVLEYCLDVGRVKMWVRYYLISCVLYILCSLSFIIKRGI